MSVDPLLPARAGLPVSILARRPHEALGPWIERHRTSLEPLLDRHGGLLFRGFDCPDQAAFVGVIGKIGSQAADLKEESSRRTSLGSAVYTATDHPPQYDIFPHHEWSYSVCVPRRVFFYCVESAAEGGETLLADGCEIWSRVAPETRCQFEARGWTLHRRYGDGLGVGWQQAYATQRRVEVERHCLTNRTAFQWVDSGPDADLITRQRRPATLIHPALQRPVWFNHICFFHRSAIPGDLLQLLLDEQCGLPFDTTYGDGGAIENQVIEELRTAYRESTSALKLHAQDILVLDNLRIAHGRRAFSGGRRVLFAAADPFNVPAA